MVPTCAVVRRTAFPLGSSRVLRYSAETLPLVSQGSDRCLDGVSYEFHFRLALPNFAVLGNICRIPLHIAIWACGFSQDLAIILNESLVLRS